MQVSLTSPRPLTNRFIVIIPAFNAAQTIAHAIASVTTQSFDDLGVIIRNDLSTDDTGKICRRLFGIETTGGNFSATYEGKEILYIENSNKLYGGGNTYDSVMHWVHNPEAVVAVVDGDDHLLHPDAITRLSYAYRDADVWLAWSQHQSTALKAIGQTGYSNPLPGDDIIYSSRQYWSVSHFRSCKAWLFGLIDPEDLKDPFTGEPFFRVAADAALLYPIIEMCGNMHSRFIDEVLYAYEDKLPTNEAAIYQGIQQEYTAFIRSKTPYRPLDHKAEAAGAFLAVDLTDRVKPMQRPGVPAFPAVVLPASKKN